MTSTKTNTTALDTTLVPCAITYPSSATYNAKDKRNILHCNKYSITHHTVTAVQSYALANNATKSNTIRAKYQCS